MSGSDTPNDCTPEQKEFLVLGTRANRGIQKNQNRTYRNPKVLAVYNPAAETKLSADASSYGLGGVLMHKVNTTWKPVACTSRSISTTEEHCTQIEKEAPAITWTCDKFAMYLLGKHFSIETDHKSLVPLLTSKPLDNLPPRILRIHLCMMKYDYTISHAPGKSLFTADTLS